EHMTESPEPTPAQVLSQGVDLVTFSGDKLLGGPQAGIIAGRQRYVAAVKKNPLFPALRCDKLILSGIQVLVEAYLRGDARPPLIEMLRVPIEALRERAMNIAVALASTPLSIVVQDAKSMLGGGSMPRAAVPSVVLDVISTSHTASS